MIGLGAALGLLLAMALILTRLFAGPTMHDRILAAHAATLIASLLAAALAALAGQPAWLDLAIVLVLTDFLIVATALKFLRYRTLQTPLAQITRSGEL